MQFGWLAAVRTLASWRVCDVPHRRLPFARPPPMMLSD
jgi:hypothetical protein